MSEMRSTSRRSRFLGVPSSPPIYEPRTRTKMCDHKRDLRHDGGLRGRRPFGEGWRSC
jgi:hypothetical protein